VCDGSLLLLCLRNAVTATATKAMTTAATPVQSQSWRRRWLPRAADRPDRAARPGPSLLAGRPRDRRPGAPLRRDPAVPESSSSSSDCPNSGGGAATRLAGISPGASSPRPARAERSPGRTERSPASAERSPGGTERSPGNGRSRSSKPRTGPATGSRTGAGSGPALRAGAWPSGLPSPEPQGPRCAEGC
jgi:hypothetical protein